MVRWGGSGWKSPQYKQLIWVLKTGRHWESQRAHERVFQKRGSGSKEKRPRGSIIGKQPDNQCSWNGQFMEMGRGKLWRGRSRQTRPAYGWNPTIYQEDMVTKGVGKRWIWNGGRLPEWQSEAGSWGMSQDEGRKRRSSQKEVLEYWQLRSSVEGERWDRGPRAEEREASTETKWSHEFQEAKGGEKREKLGCSTRNQSSSAILIKIMNTLNPQPNQSTAKTLFYRQT